MTNIFVIISFGCKLNQSNALLLRQNLLNNGFAEASSWLEASIIIVAACVVTEKAENGVLSLIRKSKKAGKRIFATGCFGDHLSEILQQEHIIFADELAIFRHLLNQEGAQYGKLLYNLGHKSRAFVKIQSGCNQYCSYCIVPYTRGEPQNRSMGEIMDEVATLYDHGIREIVLTGTQIGLFSQSEQDVDALSSLLVAIEEKFTGKLFRARLSSIHPCFVNSKLIKTLAQSNLWCNHLHLSMQSGSSKILKAMNRQYTAEEYYELTARLKKAIPDLLLTTDVIVGFPGETEEDFEDSRKMLEKINFSKVHIFPYSARKETASFDHKNALSYSKIQARKRSLLELSNLLSYNLNCTFIGKTVEVFIERDLTGFTKNYKKVVLKKDESLEVHSLHLVTVSSCDENVLYE